MKISESIAKAHDETPPTDEVQCYKSDPPSNAFPQRLRSALEQVQFFSPQFVPALKACLAVCGAMALADRKRPLCVILEAASGYGKTTTLDMILPSDKDHNLNQYVYRSDRFTPKAFVSHAANKTEQERGQTDLLPRIKDKIFVTKELATIFRGRTEELQDNFSMLISVLDGMGFTSDSGMQGQRGYVGRYMFNWLGATTPLPAETHRVMAQLGTRLLFYEVPAVPATVEELTHYALVMTQNTS